MKKLHSKWQLFLYGMGGFGVNLLNLMVASYLCNALTIGGVKLADIGRLTYWDRNLVFVGIWGTLITISKIIDGLIDIPLAPFADNFRSRWGKRRPVLLMGLIPLIISYVLFITPLTYTEGSVLNTIWMFIMLAAFYVFYTLTMSTYYATFAEVVETEKDRLAISNFKSGADIVYMVVGTALIPILAKPSFNIGMVGYCVAPLALTMLIPVFMIKEKPNRVCDVGASEKVKGVSMVKAIKHCMTNRAFVLWMCVYAALQFGLQMFIAGQSNFFEGISNLGDAKMAVMACIFAPVPLTLLLYNKIVRKKGIKWGFVYSLAIFSVAMIILIICNQNIIPDYTVRLVLAIFAGLCASFGLGCFFSISYTIPSHLAVIQKKKTGDANPAMYFAVQGLFSGIATAIATGVIWDTALKNTNHVWLMPVVVAAALAIALGLSFLLPKELNELGMGDKATEVIDDENTYEEPAKEPAEEAANDVNTEE